MRVLTLSWEYPPLVIGGIARHVADLASALVRRGVQVTVLTAATAKAPVFERREGVEIRRTRPGHPRLHGLVEEIMQLNLDLLQEAFALAQAGDCFDLVHAHDWVTAYAGKALKHGLGRPLIATIHATEYGRNNGLHTELQRAISDVEWWLGYEAWRVICCSRHMAGELRSVFQLPADKLRLIPNGVYPAEFSAGPIPSGFRERFAAPEERIIFYVGRLVKEKGLAVLLEALPWILARSPRAKLIIAGRGGQEDELKAQASRLGVYDRVYFTGYVDDETRNLLYRLAEVAVFPSLYEPFGIVALEAMSAGTPLVVSDTGGMSEIVQHGVNGLKSRTGNAVSLAENILWILEHPVQAREMSAKAQEEVSESYDWDRIAGRTEQVYQEVIGDGQGRADRFDQRVPAGWETLSEPRADRYTPASVR